jgi:tetracycline resistance efflux pump
VTLLMMVWTGYSASIADGLEISIWSIFENTDVPLSLVTGGLAGTILAGSLYLLKMKQNETASYPLMGRALVS